MPSTKDTPQPVHPLLPSTSRRRTTTTLGLAALLLTLATPPALASTATPTPASTAMPGTTAPGDQLSALAAQAAAALEAYQQAQEAQQGAEAAQAAAQTQLDAAQAALDVSRSAMGSWASDVYRGAGDLQQLSGVMALLDPAAGQDATTALAAADHVGNGLDRAVDTHEEARATQAAALAEVTATADAARAAADAALAAKTAAESLVQQQLLAYAAQQRDAAGLDTLTPDATAVERARTLLTTPATCTGAALTGYANGQLPLDALCPLAAAPDKLLRADAAHAFDALAEAFRAEFGTPLAVTDAYRSLTEQIDVKSRKPGLAATPGTSRHGLGLAVDLGSGAQDANSLQHAWLDRNAALFGFINPAWAQGSPGPFEPWHWEYVAL